MRLAALPVDDIHEVRAVASCSREPRERLGSAIQSSSPRSPALSGYILHTTSRDLRYGSRRSRDVVHILPGITGIYLILGKYVRVPYNRSLVMIVQKRSLWMADFFNVCRTLIQFFYTLYDYI